MVSSSQRLPEWKDNDLRISTRASQAILWIALLIDVGL